MARNRMITPDFWLDEELAEISPLARLLYIGLWNICDDNYATFPNKPKWIKAQIFPYNSVSTHTLLTELSNIGKIVLFRTENDEEYYFIKNFFKYQTINRPSKPKYPKFNENQGVLSEYSVSTHAKVKLSKDNIYTSEKSKKTINEEDVKKIAEKYKVSIDFVERAKEEMENWLKAKGKKYKDYRAGLRNWVLRNKDKTIKPQQPKGMVASMIEAQERSKENI